MSCCGFQNILPNKADAYYIKNNLDTYITFPPLYKSERTRWGDLWTDDKYPTATQILSDEDDDKFDIFKKEATAYTWICYVKLKEMM